MVRVVLVIASLWLVAARHSHLRQDPAATLAASQNQSQIVAVNQTTAVNQTDEWTDYGFKMKALKVLKLGEGGFALTVTKPGNGHSFPKKGDTLTVHYVGRISKTGKIFDSSRERQEPFTFVVGKGKVIRGWDQGLVEMSLGERGVLHVPSYKGYGSDGAGDGEIPPDADLDFDVELLAINEKPKTPSLDKKKATPEHSGVQHATVWVA